MRRPTIEWQVAGACNYDCTYCIQSRRYRRGRPEERDLENAVVFFANLPQRWEIKCSGGEAFAHPLFMSKVVPDLMKRTPHDISVLTNFSSTRRSLMEFTSMTRGRLRVFSASLHLEYVSVEAFADKAAWFLDQLDPEVDFVVNQVVLPGKEDESQYAKECFDERGIRWFPQLFKTKGGVAEYPDPAKLLPILGQAPSPRAANIAPSYRGRMCWAGVDYFTVDKNGDAYACRTAKRHGEAFLGNVYRGDAARMTEPTPCAYDICPCTVPANRGMIEGVAS